MAISAERQDLYQALAQVQNHPANVNQDIMTFAGFMTDDEIRAHLDRYIGHIAEFNFEQANKPSRARKGRAA